MVSVVSPVVAGERRRGRKESGKQQNQDLLHFRSSNSSLMDLGRDFYLGSPSGRRFTRGIHFRQDLPYCQPIWPRLYIQPRPSAKFFDPFSSERTPAAEEGDQRRFAQAGRPSFL